MFILIACVLLSVGVEVGTYRCPSTAPLYFPYPWTFHSRWMCISAQECRRKSFVVYGRTCVHSCPPGTFYQQEASTCYKTCPVHTIRIGSRCLNGTYCVSNNNQVLFNGTCMPSCPSSAPFTKDGSCRKECPADTVTNKSECVSPSDCIERGYFIDNMTCVKACPPKKQSILQGVCHSSCPPDRSVTVNGTACLLKQECTDKLGGFIYNNTCVPECPPTANLSNQGSCTALCPKEKCVLGNHCILVTECVRRKSVIFRNECIATCPTEAPYAIDNACYSTCPKDYVFNDDTCIGLQQCIFTLGLFKVIFNNTCVNSCPQVAPLNHQGMCVESCPGDTVVVDMQCVGASMCLDSSRFIYNGTCVSKCPGRSPYASNGYCYPACPKDFVVTTPGQFQCISESECVNMKKMVFNRTCTTACPKESPYTRSSHCYQTCPQETASLPDMKCVSYQKCRMQGNFVHESKCLHECPGRSPYASNGYCYPACPKDFVVTTPGQFQCISESECVNMKKMVFNRTCTTACPKESPYTRSSHCYQTCPQETASLPDMKCVSYQECRMQGNFVHESKCLHECPSTFPYRIHDTCILECPHNTSTFPGNKCVSPSECPTITGAVMYNGSCLPKCPSFAPYVHSRNCLSNCPIGFFAKGSDCLDNYKCQDVLYNGSCLSSCPKETPNRKDKSCYSVCPSETYSYQATCIDQYDCQEKKFYLSNGSCVPTCPPGSAGFTDYVCHPLISVYGAIMVTPFLLLMVLMCLFCMMYNPKKSRLLNAPAKLQGEQLAYREWDMVECVTSDHHPGQQQDNAEHPYEGNMEFNSDEETLPLEDHRNKPHDVDISHVVANYSNNVIVHPQRHDDDDGDDVPLLQVTSEDDPLIQQADDAFLFGDGTY